MLRVVCKTAIERISANVDDLRIWQHCQDQTKIAPVRRILVREECPVCSSYTAGSFQISSPKRLDRRLVQAAENFVRLPASMAVSNLGSHLQYNEEFFRSFDRRVTGQDLFDQGRA